MTYRPHPTFPGLWIIDIEQGDHKGPKFSLKRACDEEEAAELDEAMNDLMEAYSVDAEIEYIEGEEYIDWEEHYDPETDTLIKSFSPATKTKLKLVK